MSVNVGGGAPAAAPAVSSSPASGGGQSSGHNSPPASGLSGSSGGNTGASNAGSATNTSGVKPAQESASNTGAKPEPKYYDVKVAGRVVRMTEQEVLENASLSAAAQERFAEAARLKKETEAGRAKLKEKPIEYLLGQDVGLTKEQIRDQLEQWYHREFIEPETLSAEQREHRATLERLKKYEEQEAEQKRLKEQEDETRFTQETKENLAKQIIQALESSGLGKNPFFASRIAFYQRQNQLQGLQAPMEMVVRQVKNEFDQIFGGFAKNSSPEELHSRFGDEVIDKLVKWKVDQIKKKRSERQQPFTGDSQGNDGTGGTGSGKIYYNDVNERLRALRMGKNIPS